MGFNTLASLDRLDQAPWATLPVPRHVSAEVLQCRGSGLLMVTLALEVDVDFLAVAEHRLIPARVRGEWSRLRKKGLASMWAPASQDSSHDGNAGVGVASLRGAPPCSYLLLLLPS